MAFIPLNYEEGRIVNLPMSTGETVVVGQVTVADTDGYYITGASSAEDIRYVALEAAVTTADGQRVRHIETEGVRFLADKSTLNPDASTNAQFYLESAILPLTAKKVTGYFTRGTPNVS